MNTSRKSLTKEELAKTWLEHLRISILRFLDGFKEMGANESLLLDALNNMDIFADRQQVREALAWLQTRKLAKTRDRGGLITCEITELGEAVVAGRRIVPGVRRPSRRV